MASKRKQKRKGDGLLNILLALLLVAAVCLAAPVIFDIMADKDVLALTVEAGSALPEAAEFLPDAQEAVSYISDTSAVRMDVPGDYTLKLRQGRKEYTAVLTVRDTVKPIATAVDVTASGGSEVTADSFVTAINDATAVSVSFAQAPDTSVAGSQSVTVILTDLGGNTVQLQAALTVIVDTQAPTITGVQDRITYVGDSVAYRSGITVTDDMDAAAQLEVDSSPGG